MSIEDISMPWENTGKDLKARVGKTTTFIKSFPLVSLLIKSILTPSASSFDYFDRRIDTLTRTCIRELEDQGFKNDMIQTTPFLHLRYEGTDCALMCTAEISSLVGSPSSCRHGDFEGSFTERFVELVSEMW